MKVLKGIVSTLSILFFLFTGNIIYAQKLEGKYYLEGSGDSGPRYLTFMNEKFADTLYGHVQNGYGMGRYHISGRKLVLTYEKVPKQDSSTYIIKSSALNTREGKLSTKLFLDGEVCFGYVFFRDRDFKSIKKIETNKKGIVDLVIPDDNNLEIIEIVGLFYYPFIISKEQLLGKSTEIEVHFRDAEKYYALPGTDIYTIKKKGRNKFILYSDKGRELVFTRAISNK